VPHAVVAKAFRLSPSWALTLIREFERKICEAANEERHHPTLAATRRLQEAGALPKPYFRGVFWLGDEPPKSWPVTLRRNKVRDAFFEMRDLALVSTSLRGGIVAKRKIGRSA
jgi:hypothetical protein